MSRIALGVAPALLLLLSARASAQCSTLHDYSFTSTTFDIADAASDSSGIPNPIIDSDSGDMRYELRMDDPNHADLYQDVMAAAAAGCSIWIEYHYDTTLAVNNRTFDDPLGPFASYEAVIKTREKDALTGTVTLLDVIYPSDSLSVPCAPCTVVDHVIHSVPIDPVVLLGILDPSDGLVVKAEARADTNAVYDYGAVARFKMYTLAGDEPRLYFYL